MSNIPMLPEIAHRPFCNRNAQFAPMRKPNSSMRCLRLRTGLCDYLPMLFWVAHPVTIIRMPLALSESSWWNVCTPQRCLRITKPSIPLCQPIRFLRSDACPHEHFVLVRNSLHACRFIPAPNMHSAGLRLSGTSGQSGSSTTCVAKI